MFTKAMWQKEINWFISTTTTAISALEEDEKVFLVFFGGIKADDEFMESRRDKQT
jgi:hypothetical protein